MRRLMEFLDYVRSSDWLREAIRVSETLGLQNYYVAGGAVTQVEWNQLTGVPMHNNIKDVDVVYFDAKAVEAEQEQLQQAFSRAVGGKFAVDVTNQALVHRWYADRFGSQIAAYQRVEDGIDAWLSAFAIGIRAHDDEWVVYAPYGLDDLLDMKVRPNRKQITKEIYMRMVSHCG